MFPSHDQDVNTAHANDLIQKQFLTIAQTELTYDQADKVRQEILEVAENTKAKTFENYINEIKATLHTNHNWITMMQETGTSGGSISQLASSIVGSLSYLLKGLFKKQQRLQGTMETITTPKGSTVKSKAFKYGE